jgi:hypothetical protein
MGLRTESSVSGDLPFGLGLASSTVLAFLHLNGQADTVDHQQIVNFLDWIQHGFRPSGVDYAAIQAQSPGFFLRGCWRPGPPCPVACVIAALPPAPDRPPGQTLSVMQAIAPRLRPVAVRLTQQLEATGELSFDDLGEYCLLLSKSGAYSQPQQALVAAALSQGIVAKGVGGLYNKAMLLFGDLEACLRFASRYPDLTVISTVGGPAVVEDGLTCRLQSEFVPGAQC